MWLDLRENTHVHAISSDRRTQMCPLFCYKGHTRIFKGRTYGKNPGLDSAMADLLLQCPKPRFIMPDHTVLPRDD